MSMRERIVASSTVAAIVLMGSFTPISALAWGPTRETFTMNNPAPYNTFDSIIDNPNFGDERNFFRVRPVDQTDWNPNATNGWTDTLVIEEDKEYEAKVYVNNAAADNLSLTATNVRVTINLPVKAKTYGTAFEINAYIDSDNAVPSEGIWDNIILKSDDEFHLQVNSAKYYNNIRTEDDGGFDLGDELYRYKAGGALIGYEQMDGLIKGDMAQSGFVLVRFTPVFKNKVLRWLKHHILDRLLTAWETDEMKQIRVMDRNSN